MSKVDSLRDSNLPSQRTVNVGLQRTDKVMHVYDAVRPDPPMPAHLWNKLSIAGVPVGNVDPELPKTVAFEIFYLCKVR